MPGSTQVGIIGGGPAGMLLALLLHQAGIDTVVLERQSRAHVLGRIRAGLLEPGTVSILVRARALKAASRHDGCLLSLGGRLVRIDFAAIGQMMTVQGQTEITRDLYDACDAAGIWVVTEAAGVMLAGLPDGPVTLAWRDADGNHTMHCEHVAGCDGFHGISRRQVPASVMREYEHAYPFGWLGVLSPTPPAADELIYGHSPHGFCLCSMRSPTLSRHYVQCPLDDRVDDWDDDRFWRELKRRLPAEVAADLVTAPSVEKSIAPLRSYVAEPMSWGRLHLVGDAAHIVPPTGAKGLNLALADAAQLAAALAARLNDGDPEPLERYSTIALARAWKAVRFSWWMTNLLHEFPDDDNFTRRLRAAEHDHLARSAHARAALAESYTGLPLVTA